MHLPVGLHSLNTLVTDPLEQPAVQAHAQGRSRHLVTYSTNRAGQRELRQDRQSLSSRGLLPSTTGLQANNTTAASGRLWRRTHAVCPSGVHRTFHEAWGMERQGEFLGGSDLWAVF